jgi:CHAD domain-containing protein
VPKLRDSLAEQAAAIRTRAEGVSPDGDAEELHKLRVAIRRLRALLRAARPSIQDDRLEPLRERLAELGRALGPARDLDVFSAYVRGEQSTLDGDASALTPLLVEVEAERRAAYADALAALSAPSFAKLVDDLDEFSASVVVREEPGDALVRRELKRLAKAMRDISSDEALHNARIHAKRVRYAAEVAGDKRVATRAKRLQDVAGEHQDAVVAEERLRALAGTNGGIAVGRLVERQQARREAAQARVPKAWRKLAKTAR